MNRWAPYIINGITWYRLVAALLLALLIFKNRPDLFRWLLPLSFFTDAIDGYLARRYKTASRFGARLDSLADLLTILAAVAGMFVFKWPFVKENLPVILFVLALYAGQTILALLRYRRISSFHTYLAKAGTVVSALFLALAFLLPQPPNGLFYAVILITSLELLEEILLVFLLPKWKANVKGLYWVLQAKKK